LAIAVVFFSISPGTIFASETLPIEVEFNQAYKIILTTGSTVSPACCKSAGYFRLKDSDSFLLCGNAKRTIDVLRFRRLFSGGGI